MRTLPPEPNPGDKVSANLVRELIRAIRERTLLNGVGYKVNAGPNGTKLLIEKSKDVVSASSGSDRSCFRFGSVTVTVGGESETHTALVCCYYATGGILHHMADFDIEAILPQAPAQGQTPVVTFLCFKLTAGNPSIVAITENDLAGEQNDVANYVRPLYRYEGATLTDDLRNALTIQQVEVA